jgi:hypothetical protein
MGRFDEAKDAALPGDFRRRPADGVAGPRLLVEARRGRFDVACREMQALVTLEPHYYWGWQQLAEWYNETGKSDQYLEAAEKLVDLRPDSPWRSRCAARPNSRPTIARARPIYAKPQKTPRLFVRWYAALRCLSTGRRFKSAAPHSPSFRNISAARDCRSSPPAMLNWRREKDMEAALNALRDACSFPATRPGPSTPPWPKCRKADWSKETDQVLSDVILNAADFHPYTLFAWLEGRKDRMLRSSVNFS